ncbi:olfactory receptor 8S1-like [Rhynchocyon petersi]
MAWSNHTTITEFILLGLSNDSKIQALLFVLFLGIYLLTVMGNLMLLLVIKMDCHLHSPMYFFLSHLSIDLCFSSVTVPKMLENLQSQKKTISVMGCLVQIFFIVTTGGIEVCVLSVMSYDRYVAICHPLLYAQVMSKQHCMQLLFGSWILGFLDALVNVILAMKIDFCDTYIIPHFSCELPSIFHLSCSDISTNLIVMFCSIIPHGLVTSLSVLFSYVCIIFTILNITSTTGRSKAFSTCSSHLTVVIFFYGSAFLRYLLPTSGSPLELVFSVQYTVITPMLNPLIYSLKNKEVKEAVKRTLVKCLGFKSQNKKKGSRELNQGGMKLSDTDSQSNSTAKSLDSLQLEVVRLDSTVKELSEQLEFIKNSNVQGVLNSITKYFQLSLEAEEMENSSTIDPNSTWEQLALTRDKVEDLMLERESQFRGKQEEQYHHLDKLAGKVQSLDLSATTEMTYGTPSGASCSRVTLLSQVPNVEDQGHHCGDVG